MVEKDSELSMAGRPPLVSIGMPVYNGECFMRQALDSLLGQDYENIELIISDNASTDATRLICLEYAARDHRIRYHRNDVNLGAIDNFNRVVELSRGEYFMWAADHDLWESRYVSSCVEIMEYDKSVALCCSRTAWIDTHGNCLETIANHLDTRGLDRVSRFHTVIWGLAYCYQIYGVIRASALNCTEKFCETIGPDNVLLAELSLLGAFAWVPETLFYLRRMPDFGSWPNYTRKLNKRLTRHTAIYLFLQQIVQHLRVVNRHVCSYFGKIVLMQSIVLCLLVKYRGTLKGLANQARRGEAEPGDLCQEQDGGH